MRSRSTWPHIGQSKPFKFVNLLELARAQICRSFKLCGLLVDHINFGTYLALCNGQDVENLEALKIVCMQEISECVWLIIFFI